MTDEKKRNAMPISFVQRYHLHARDTVELDRKSGLLCGNTLESPMVTALRSPVTIVTPRSPTKEERRPPCCSISNASTILEGHEETRNMKD